MDILDLPVGSKRVPALTVDSTMDRRTAIKRGAYANEEQAIQTLTPKRYPSTATGTASFCSVLLAPPGKISTSDWIAWMHTRGIRKAGIDPLLALGAQIPEIQRDYHILAFGCVSTDDRGRQAVPGLWVYGEERRLDTYWCPPDYVWDEFARVLILE